MIDMLTLREKLAAIEHERWADWQAWMHSKLLSDKLKDGTWVRYLPGPDLVKWERQIRTHYDELSFEDQESDRLQVERYWPLIQPLMLLAEAVQRQANCYHEDGGRSRLDADVLDALADVTA